MFFRKFDFKEFSIRNFAVNSFSKERITRTVSTNLTHFDENQLRVKNPLLKSRKLKNAIFLLLHQVDDPENLV